MAPAVLESWLKGLKNDLMDCTKGAFFFVVDSGLGAAAPPGGGGGGLSIAATHAPPLAAPCDVAKEVGRVWLKQGRAKAEFIVIIMLLQPLPPRRSQ